MALDAACGTLNVTTAAATGTVAVSGLGFQPKLILTHWTGRTTTGVARGTKNSGFGAATGTSNRFAVSSVSVDAQTAAFANTAHHDAALITSLSTTGTFDGLMDLQSIDADGFTLVIDDAFPSDLLVQYLALGGTSITNVTTGMFSAIGTTGSQSVTGVGFQPDVILLFGANISANPPTDSTSDSTFTFGAATSSSDEHTISGASNTGSATMITRGYCLSGEIYGGSGGNVGNNTAARRAELTSLDADGFTLNWIANNTDSRIFYVAIAGLDVVVGNLLTATTTTTISESGFGFEPSAVMVLSQGQAQNTAGTTAAEDRWSVGFATSTSSRNVGASIDENGTADSEVTLNIRTDAVYSRIHTDSTVVGLMDVQSFDSDGITFIMDDADPSQAFVWYIAFGPAEDGGGGDAKPWLYRNHTHTLGAGFVRGTV